MIRDPYTDLHTLQSMYEDPKYHQTFEELEEENERRRLEVRLEIWEREVGTENRLRKQDGYCLASTTPPKEWDGTTNSALEYLMRTRRGPPGSAYTPASRLNFHTTNHPRRRSPSPSLPLYNGPSPDNWYLNYALTQRERERTQGSGSAQPGGSIQGRYQGDGTWADVNMHHDRRNHGTLPANSWQASRFNTDDDGPYAKLQRKL
jgi:hypothetical protein